MKREEQHIENIKEVLLKATEYTEEILFSLSSEDVKKICKEPVMILKIEDLSKIMQEIYNM